jgi:hypothetical protein
MQEKLKCMESIQKAWKRVRSLARIKASAFGAGNRGFKSHRTRHQEQNHLYVSYGKRYLDIYEV